MQLNQDTLDMRKKERYAKVVNTLHESALVPAESLRVSPVLDVRP